MYTFPPRSTETGTWIADYSGIEYANKEHAEARYYGYRVELDGTWVPDEDVTCEHGRTLQESCEHCRD